MPDSYGIDVLRYVNAIKRLCFMIRIYIFLLLIWCFSKSYGQTERTKFNLSVRYLAAGDITAQSPDKGKTFENGSFFIVPGFDINVEFPMQRNLWLSTGYRWKQRWISITAPVSYNIEVPDNDLHVVFTKLAWRKALLQSYLPDVFSFDAGGGIMLGSMTKNYSDRITNLGEAGHTGAIYWKSTPKYYAGLDGMINLNFRLYKRLYASAGYGFNYGFTKIKKGYYSFSDLGGVIESGTVTSRGSYIYLLTGLKIQF